MKNTIEKLMVIEWSIPKRFLNRVYAFLLHIEPAAYLLGLAFLSILYFVIFYKNGLGLSYNDARSHLDIGRRVVEGLKPGLAQLGSVWLPLNHVLMIPTIWNDWMWHSGLAGALQSMAGFVVTGYVIYLILKELNVGLLGRLVGVAVFAANLNVLYLQSTAMTELLLIATMTVGVYELIMWHKNDDTLHLIKSAFWIMLSTLTRYDGWFLLGYACLLIMIQAWRKKGLHTVEGVAVLFLTLGGLGIVLWILWNLLIFKDPLYFILGPFSAHAQQMTMKAAGVLYTEHNLRLSVQSFMYAFFYNSYTIPALISFVGAIVLWFDKKLSLSVRISTSALFAPLLFNIIALYFGFSVLFIQGIIGGTWFNVRYGILLMPTVAIFIGYLVGRAPKFRGLIILILCFVLFFALANKDAVTIDDARVGSSQKNVSQVSGYLHKNALNQKGFILISAASHDAIIFSSGLPMSRFIHEGTGLYWKDATTIPDRWARWIVMRTYDDNDLTWKAVSRTPGFKRYHKVAAYPFADVYELDSQYLGQLNTTASLGKQK
ncbi:MAG TPA: hypothetical protein VMR81_05410 [Patescibacteria group bacterium]|nr:hypothetical protein [Patescibacteria group bacterium]